METFSIFPLNELDDPETFYLDPDSLRTRSYSAGAASRTTPV